MTRRVMLAMMAAAPSPRRRLRTRIEWATTTMAFRIEERMDGMWTPTTLIFSGCSRAQIEELAIYMTKSTDREFRLGEPVSPEPSA